MKSDNVTDFLKAHGCDSTADELKEFVAEKVNRNRPLRELSEDELENVAGGTGMVTTDCSGYCSDNCTKICC